MIEKNHEDGQQVTDEELVPDKVIVDQSYADESAADPDAAETDENNAATENVGEGQRAVNRDGQDETLRATAKPLRTRERAPSRRTIQREQRRRRSSSRKARKRTVYGMLGGIVAAALILGLALPSFTGLITPDQAASENATGNTPSIGTAVPVQASRALADGESYSAYQSVPPTSGPSYATAIEWGFHAEQQPDEAVVRNLQQGGIIANYNLADEAQLVDLKNYLEAQPGYPGCFIIQPHIGVPEDSITLTSWGWMETYTGVDRPGMEEFLQDHRNDAPLFLGLTCGAPTTLDAPEPVVEVGE